MIKIEVDPQSLREVGDYLKASQKQVRLATRRAQRKTSAWAATQVIRRMASSHDIPQKVLRGGASGSTQGSRPSLNTKDRRKRGQRVVSRASSVWVGYDPIKSGYLGAVRQAAGGARAGRHKFADAFVAQLQSGHRGAFRRKGSSVRRSPGAWSPNLPIEEARLELARGRMVAQSVQREVPVRLKGLLARELSYEVDVRGRG